MSKETPQITGEMLARYHELHAMKKEIDAEMSQLKKKFHAYFDDVAGQDTKGEIVGNGYKLQRQIRKSEKFHEEKTVQRLTALNMSDLIETVRRPDAEKINAAVQLGLLRDDDLEDCRVLKFSAAISVKETKEEGRLPEL
ncbi:hypothetical protein [Lentibacillus sediminis]|uniref:hypothetical protein n=1 Tax=Lentibacillus sediminis TaxID=1940529 RepID=UPI000C1C18AB|nr:hypothetical protein [Lentibacillus sediminis]